MFGIIASIKTFVYDELKILKGEQSTGKDFLKVWDHVHKINNNFFGWQTTQIVNYNIAGKTQNKLSKFNLGQEIMW